jgi:ABC-type transport system substrate-binding protein
LDEGLAETDPDKVKAIYEELQRIIIADHPFLWLAYPATYYYHSPELKGFIRAPLADSYINSWRDLWLEGE